MVDAVYSSWSARTRSSPLLLRYRQDAVPERTGKRLRIPVP